MMALALPLTHLLSGARAIMFDGAGLADVALELGALAGLTVLCIGLAAWLFRWRTD